MLRDKDIPERKTSEIIKNEKPIRAIRLSSGFTEVSHLVSSEQFATNLKLILALFKKKLGSEHQHLMSVVHSDTYYTNANAASPLEGVNSIQFVRQIEISKKSSTAAESLLVLSISLVVTDASSAQFFLKSASYDLATMDLIYSHLKFETFSALVSYVEMKLKQGEPILVNDEQLRTF